MNRQADLSEEMYKRIYRLIKRQIDPRIIATTLHIPVRTIEGIVSRIDRTSVEVNEDEIQKITKESLENADRGFLDIYFYSKTRYGIIQVVGTLIGEHLEAFSLELNKAYEISLKAVAIRMTDVTMIDEEAGKMILKFHEKFQSLGRFSALLDPQPAIESSLSQFHLDTDIPIFGTERAFEDAAFSRRNPSIIKRNHN
jgi:anti-anti-sigma regulatory factor